VALYWAFIYFEGELHAPSLLIGLLLGSVWLLGLWVERGWLVVLIGAGTLLGLAGLVRPNVLLFVPVAAIWAAWVARRSGTPLRNRFAIAAAVAVPAALAVSVATIRNAVVSQDLVPISSNTGINLYIGNNPAASGFCADEIPGLGPFGTCFDYPGVVRNLERRLGRPLEHSEVSDWFTTEAFRFMRENPGRVLQLIARKLWLFWGPTEVGHNKEIHYERRFSRVLRALPGNFALVLALGLVGFVLLVAGHRRREQGGRGRGAGPRDVVMRWELAVLVALLILVLSVSVLPFFVAGRYRVPIVPFLLLFGGHALFRIGGWLIQRRILAALAWAAACTGVYAVLVLLPAGYMPSLAQWHYLRGTCHLAARRAPEAEAEFRSAIQAERRHARAHYNLASILVERGDVNEAVEHLRESVRLRPDLSRPWHNLGAALLRLGRADEAARHLQEAVRLEPRSVQFRNNLGRALVRSGRTEEAVEQFRETLRIRPHDAEAHYEMGLILMRAGRTARAAEHLGASVRNAPDWMQAHAGLANVLQAQNHIPEALEHYRRALEIRDDPLVANNMAWLLATHPEAEHRDGTQAVRLAERACRMTRDENPRFLDTLAAAYAEAGEFARAEETLEKAIEIARSSGDTRSAEGMAERLRSYRQQRPHRDPPP
ncbi:MAG: tetratricopeptide repeat protein, partial [Candidatus Krumholzibacteriia bacterium]